MLKPSLFIVGQPKSGTTALHNFLDQHPEISMSIVKEPNHFSKDFHQESDSFYKKKLYFPYRAEKEYLKIFNTKHNPKIIGESSTLYLYSKVAAQEIYKFNPDSKIIIILRNPVDFIYSLHSEYIILDRENIIDFKSSLSLEESRKSGKNIPYAVKFPSRLFYSERAKYYDQIKRYFDVFPVANIKTIIYEDFKKNNQKTYQEIIDFLGLTAEFKLDFDQINISKAPRNIIVNSLINNPFLKKKVRVLGNILPLKTYIKIKDFVKENVLLKKYPRTLLDTKIRQELMTQFKPEVIKISRFLNINLVEKWGY